MWIYHTNDNKTYCYNYYRIFKHHYTVMLVCCNGKEALVETERERERERNLQHHCHFIILSRMYDRFRDDEDYIKKTAQKLQHFND